MGLGIDSAYRNQTVRQWLQRNFAFERFRLAPSWTPNDNNPDAGITFFARHTITLEEDLKDLVLSLEEDEDMCCC